MENNETVTSKANGSVYLVTPWPADFEADDIRPGFICVMDADGVQFSLRESKVTPGGTVTRTPPKPPAPRERPQPNYALIKAEEQARRYDRYHRTGR
jgi:hypothetical protein